VTGTPWDTADICACQRYPDPHWDALKTAWCREGDIYRDNTSGARASRPGAGRLCHALEAGDTFLASRLGGRKPIRADNPRMVTAKQLNN